MRPEQLSSHFPRIAHELALLWNDTTECQAALDRLLASERKGRQGFPPPVQRELTVLRVWMDGLQGWDAPF